jgi:hypothetical protein
VGIAAEGPTLSGELKDVDATKRTIKVLVTTRTDPTDKTKTTTEEKSIAVADNAKVALRGQKNATLGDLKVGETVAVRLSAAGDKVFTISSPAKRPDGTKKPEKPAKPAKLKTDK